MTRQPDAAHADAARRQPLAQVTHFVGSPGQAMDEQGAHTRAPGGRAGKEKLLRIDARWTGRWRLVGIRTHREAVGFLLHVDDWVAAS